VTGGERFDTVVIGGGQAGLAAAYYLSQIGVDFVVLESQGQVGSSWHRRWDSLRLFTPTKFSSLPGKRLDRDDFYFPSKDEIGNYLKAYAQEFRLPIRLNICVDSLTRTDGVYQITAGPKTFLADHVIVATGSYQKPFTPPLAQRLNPSIAQLHSDAYKNPHQLPDGSTLVVGAGNSGAEIAIELAESGRSVWLAGRDVGHIPADKVGRILGGKPYWFFLGRVLSIDTPIGRKVRKKALHQGAPLINLNPKEITDSGVIRCGRVAGTSDGMPQLEDGRVMNVAGIVWATGYRYDFSWIKLPIFDERGYPLHERGSVPQAAGIHFLGLHFQTALNSALLGGVHRDAQYIVGKIQSGRSGN